MLTGVALEPTQVPAGGANPVMAAQIEHLISMMQRPKVTLQVLTFDAGAHPGMPGSFVHMEFRDDGDPGLVYIDTQAGDIFIEADEDLRRPDDV